MTGTLDETSIGYLLLRYCAPPTITVIVGGLLTYLIFPLLQDGVQRGRQRTARRGELAEEIAERLQSYIVAWRRLMQIAALERDRPLAPAEQDRKTAFVDQRNALRDALFTALCRARFYYSTQTWEVMRAFMDWDENQSSKRLEELPGIEVWRAHEEGIIACLRREL